MARDLPRGGVVRTRIRIYIYIVGIITCMRTLRFVNGGAVILFLVLCFLSTRLSAVPLLPSTHNFESITERSV